MPKTYTYDLGGKTRTFRYTVKEREELESRFGCDLLQLIRTKILPPSEDGQTIGCGVFRAQVALVHAGLKHGGTALTEKRVQDWMEQEMAAEREDGKSGFLEAVSQACMAVYASGVLGFKWEPSDEDESKEQAETTP